MDVEHVSADLSSNAELAADSLQSVLGPAFFFFVQNPRPFVFTSRGWRTSALEYEKVFVSCEKAGSSVGRASGSASVTAAGTDDGFLKLTQQAIIRSGFRTLRGAFVWAQKLMRASADRFDLQKSELRMETSRLKMEIDASRSLTEYSRLLSVRDEEFRSVRHALQQVVFGATNGRIVLPFVGSITRVHTHEFRCAWEDVGALLTAHASAEHAHRVAESAEMSPAQAEAAEHAALAEAVEDLHADVSHVIAALQRAQTALCM